MQSMSNRNEQNGRQPPLPTQPVPCDSELNGENFITNDKKEICKDFVWGKCNKRAKCKFRHELDFEAMKRILVFCHDYQNKSRCMRENCTYLHATKEEENLFLETGQLPRVLAERHSNMAATAAETIPQIALFIQESLVAPPPPPPPPVTAGAPAQPLPVPAPVSAPFVAQRSNSLPLQQMPPPPPPPTVPSTPVMFPWNSVYTGPQQNMTKASTSTASPTFPVFYATRPPPTIQMKNGPLKRKAPESDGPPHNTPTASTSTASTSTASTSTASTSTASTSTVSTSTASTSTVSTKNFGIFDTTKPPPSIQAKNGLAKWKPPESDAHHSKMKKKEEEIVADAQCEQCKRRCVRLEEYKQNLEKLQREDEYQSLIYRRKLEDLQNGKEELKSHVSPELFSCINEYIENLPIPHLEDTYSPVFNADRSTTVPRQFLIQLMDFILNTDRHFDSSSSTNLQRDESLLQMLKQRASPQNADVLHLIMDILRQSNTGERGSTSEINGDALKSLGSSNNESRFHRFSNGQSPHAESPGRVSQTQTQTYAYPPPAPPALPPPVVPAPPPPVPPPTSAASRLYYPSTFPVPTSGGGSTSSSQVNVASAPPPPATAPPPAPQSPYQLGRFPPPYYQRHQ